MPSLAPFLARFAATSPTLRIAAFALLLALVLGALVVGVATHAPRGELFATPLRPDQVSEVEDALAAWSVPFVPTSDNVVVDTSRRSALLLRLSLAGIPHAHVATTSETLSTVGVLTPQSVIDAQARSGLAGDIELGLRSIAGIQDARVIVAPAQGAEFADERAHDATASVRLHLRPGARLSPAQVAGVRAFVAASVPQLDARRVTILDDDGVALDDAPDGAPDADALQRSLQSALDTALGAGASVVRVSEERTHATSERRDTLRTPAGTVAISHVLDAESLDDGARHYRKESDRDERGSETRVTVTRDEPGALMRLSTAVFVDAARNLDLARVRELAAASVGYDARRGDTLTVAAVDFGRAVPARRDAWSLVFAAVASLVPTLALLVAVLAIVKASAPGLGTLARTLLERAAIERTTRTVAGYAPAHVRGALAHEPPHAAAAIISALPTATAAAVLELYPQHEREAIVKRMQSARARIVPEPHEIFDAHG